MKLKKLRLNSFISSHVRCWRYPEVAATAANFGHRKAQLSASSARAPEAIPTRS